MGRNPLTYEEIMLASQGDPLAMEKVVQRFNPYIRSQCSQIRDNGYGKTSCNLNNDKMETIISRLMMAITKFDIDRYNRNQINELFYEDKTPYTT